MLFPIKSKSRDLLVPGTTALIRICLVIAMISALDAEEDEQSAKLPPSDTLTNAGMLRASVNQEYAVHSLGVAHRRKAIPIGSPIPAPRYIHPVECARGSTRTWGHTDDEIQEVK